MTEVRGRSGDRSPASPRDCLSATVPCSRPFSHFEVAPEGISASKKKKCWLYETFFPRGAVACLLRTAMVRGAKQEDGLPNSTVAIPVCVGGADRPIVIGPELSITRIHPRRPEGRRALLSPPSAPYKGPSSPTFISPLWWPCWHFNLRLALGRWVRSSPTSTCPRSIGLREAIPFHRVTLVARQLPSRY